MKEFHNRQDAGKQLAEALKIYANRADTLVLALPRGGVPVAYEIAKQLILPFDIFIVRKLGVPWHEELAMGAVASGGITVFNEDILQDMSISSAEIESVKQQELLEIGRRETLYRANRPAPDLTGKIIILVDDGIATGATMRAAIKAIRQLKPAQIVMAVPVVALSTCDELAPLVDEVVCLFSPTLFNAVGEWYEDFTQTTDEEVTQLLNKVTK